MRGRETLCLPAQSLAPSSLLSQNTAADGSSLREALLGREMEKATLRLDVCLLTLPLEGHEACLLQLQPGEGLVEDWVWCPAPWREGFWQSVGPSSRGSLLHASTWKVSRLQVCQTLLSTATVVDLNLGPLPGALKEKRNETVRDPSTLP